MTACMCLLAFSKRLRRATTPAAVRAEWGKLPAECSDSRCSPGGCRKNCADYSAGVELQLNRMPKQTKPPKSTRGRK
jgi:hypothetical protein